MNESKFQKRGVDYALLFGERTLPGKYYHDPAIHQEELDKIFYQHWQFACRSEEIPNAGDFKILVIGDEQIIVLRDKEGEVGAFFNVCSHRGTQLCTESQGTFDKGSIQCPYHAWTYDLKGNLIGAPMMKETETFKKADCGLPTAAIYNWEGFIFISLAANPVPFEQQMKGLMGKFSDWNMSGLRIAHQIEYNLKCNWKLILQNYQECYHCPGAIYTINGIHFSK